MKLRHFTGLCMSICISAFFLLGTMQTAQAVQPRQLLLAEATVSLEQAIRSVRSKYNAKVLSATEIQSKGPLVYKVKILGPSLKVKS